MLLKCCSFSAGLIDGWSTAQINTGMKGMEAETLIWGCCRNGSQRWRDQSAERHYKWGKSWKQLRLSLGRKFLASFEPVSSLFFSFLPIFFFWLGWGGLWHNASASGGSSNTLLWPKYSSVARWLAKRRSRSGGGGVGTGLGWCGTSTSPVSVGAPLKFKYLSELEIDPFLWLSLPLCCHSSVTPPLQFLSITVSPLHPSRLQHQKEE